MACFESWYQEHYPNLSNQGLWLRGGEINSIAKDEFNKRNFKTLFVRLSTYFDTGYSFTHQLLYQVAENTPGVFPDLAYLPPRSDVEYFKKHSIPWLLGTQSKRSAEEFDLIGFSNSIVQELINLPQFLSTSGIPLSKKERLEQPQLPLVILGGANALYSSSLWCDDPLVDGIFVGESDQALRDILEICRNGKEKKLSKVEILNLLETVSGFFQPDRPRKTKKSFIPNLNQSEALEKGLVYFLSDQIGNSHLQISEGCPCFCSFCAESWDRKPYRERGANALMDVALRAKASMGLDSIDIYSFNFNMHSELYQILWDLVGAFDHVGLKSQRFDLLAHDPLMVEFQHAIEKASITCGLEGISPRLRKYLHKNLENEQLHKSLAAIFKSKTRELKMFLIATGLEEDQDLVALGDLLDHLKSVQLSSHSSTRIIFSMTPLVRFPWTPLEFENAYSIEHYERIIKKTASKIRAAGFEFRESADLPEYWVSQILVRADKPGIQRALLKSLEKTNYIYYRDISESFMMSFASELKANGIDLNEQLKGFSLAESYNKPWTMIETGVKREFLWEEVSRARLFKELDYCLGRTWTQAKCFHCGGCPTRFHVQDIVLSQQKRKYSLEQFKERIAIKRKNVFDLKLAVSVGEKARGMPRKIFATAVVRSILRSFPQLTQYYRKFSGSSFSDSDRNVWIIGDEVLTLRWDLYVQKKILEFFADKNFIEKINSELGDRGRILGLSDEVWKETALPKKIKFETESRLQAADYFKSRGLKYTYRKMKDQSIELFEYELIPQSIKKGFIKSLKQTSDGWELEPGHKFILNEFLPEVFLDSWVKVRSRSFFL